MPEIYYAIPNEWNATQGVDWGEWQGTAQQAYTVYRTYVSNDAEARLFWQYFQPAEYTYSTGWVTGTVDATRVTSREWQPTNSTYMRAPTPRAQRVYLDPMDDAPDEEALADARRRQERFRAHRRSILDAAERRDQAHERAMELLRLVLTTEEYERYESKDEIVITGSHGGRYHIQMNDYQGNVDQLDEQGQRQMTLCAHPVMWVGGGELPQADAWVAQVLALKTDEESFLAVSNIHWARGLTRRNQRRVPYLV